MPKVMQDLVYQEPQVFNVQKVPCTSPFIYLRKSAKLERIYYITLGFQGFHEVLQPEDSRALEDICKQTVASALIQAYRRACCTCEKD